MFYRPEEPHGLRGDPLNAIVVPRPIGWISTLDAQGRANLAPYSFFNAVAYRPPQVMFSASGPHERGGLKDSLANIAATGEFVVNLAPEPLFEQINATATDFPSDLDEFAEVGLEREPSARVTPPRVARSPVAIECVLQGTEDFGTSVVVFGRVVLISIAEDVLVDGYPEIERLRPLARLGRRQWSTIGEVKEIGRIKYENWIPGKVRGDD